MKKLLTLLAIVFCLDAGAQCPVTATAEYSIICNGMTDVLVASGATSCTWQPTTNRVNTSITGDTIEVLPTSNTIYTVTGTTGTCTATNTVAITVNNCTTPIPVLSLSAHTICVGHCIIYSDSTQYTSTKPLTYTFVFVGGASPQGHIYPPAGNSFVSGDTLFCTTTGSTPLNPIKVCYYVNSALNENDTTHHVFGYFPVTEIVANGLGQTSSLIDSVKVSGCAGIEQYNINNNMSVYPNPATTSLQVSLAGNSANSTLVITDMLGNTVKQVSVSSQQVLINVADLSEGVYNVSIISNEGAMNKRVVIVR